MINYRKLSDQLYQPLYEAEEELSIILDNLNERFSLGNLKYNSINVFSNLDYNFEISFDLVASNFVFYFNVCEQLLNYELREYFELFHNEYKVFVMKYSDIDKLPYNKRELSRMKLRILKSYKEFRNVIKEKYKNEISFLFERCFEVRMRCCGLPEINLRSRRKGSKIYNYYIDKISKLKKSSNEFSKYNELTDRQFCSNIIKKCF